MISSVFVFVPNLSLRLQVTPQHPFDQSQPHIHHQQPSFAPHYSLPPLPYSSREDEVRTLFIAGLPDDTKTREIYNLFREFPGFQNCQLKRSGPSSQMATQEKTDTRAKWNENHRTHLVKLLGDYNVPAYRSQNGWTKEAWNRILRDMVTKFPNLKCTIVQVKALEQELKKIYKLLKGFTELSGFGWDNEKNMVEATEEVWAPLFERNKEARRWHQKPFPYFTALQEIYEGRYAEGRRSRDVDYYSNVPMTTPYPSIPAPNDPIESLSTPEIETEDHDFAQTEPPCSQPYISQPQTSCSARRQSVGDERRKKDRKRKNIQEAFLEKYMDMRRAENERYIDAMKTNKVEEKYTIGECMAAFNMVCDQLSDDEFVKATTLFKDKDNREIFLNLNEDRKVLWLRQMIN